MRHVKLLSLQDFSDAAGLLRQAPHPEGSLGWFRTLSFSTLAAGEKAVFAIAYDDEGAERAVLPLALALDGSLRSLTAPYTTRYTPGLPDPQWSQYLGERAASYVTNTMRLDALDLGDAGLLAYFKGLNQSGLEQQSFGHFANWYATIGNFAAYWDTRPERLKATVRRKLKAAGRTHALGFRLVTDPRALAESVKDYLQVYGSSWKEPEPYPDFIATMIRELGQEGLVRLGILTIDGDVAAAQIWLGQGPRWTIFKLAHGTQFATFSPGTLLTYWLLRSLCTNGQEWEVDFGRGNDAYKRDWLENCRFRGGSVVVKWRNLSGLATLISEIYPMRLAKLWREFHFRFHQ